MVANLLTKPITKATMIKIHSVEARDGDYTFVFENEFGLSAKSDSIGYLVMLKGRYFDDALLSVADAVKKVNQLIKNGARVEYTSPYTLQAKCVRKTRSRVKKH